MITYLSFRETGKMALCTHPATLPPTGTKEFTNVRIFANFSLQIFEFWESTSISIRVTFSLRLPKIYIESKNVSGWREIQFTYKDFCTFSGLSNYVSNIEVHKTT